jgi:arylsulfatase A-like enzyme
MIPRRAVVAAPFLHLASRAAARRPNVVMVMTDDHGAWAMGAYGCSDIKTPHLDKLAAEGARFTRAFACTPVCSPSRLTYITGRIPSVHGVQDWLVPKDSFEPATTKRWLEGHPTYSGILARNGYTLGMSGKWHMGEDDKAQEDFSFWATVPGGGGTFRNPKFVKNGEKIRYQGFKTNAVGDYALEFLERQKPDNPFYLLVPFYAPHTPYDFQPEEFRAPYRDSKFPCFPREKRHPWANRSLRTHHLQEESMRSYSALVTGVDANVGRIVRLLEERGLRENTLIVFTADQGYNCGHHGFWGKGNGTWPFNMYEESIRVPMIWNQPGRIKPGQTPDAMVSSYDYFPTILDYLGVAAPKDPKRPGRSYAGVVRGERPLWPNRLYFEYSFVRGLRTENLKYVERTKEWPSELYDLEADPGEKRNVIDAPAYQKQLESLRTDLAGWFRRAGAPPIEQWRSTTTQNLTVYGR